MLKACGYCTFLNIFFFWFTAGNAVQAMIVKGSHNPDTEGKSLVGVLCRVMESYQRSTVILIVSFKVLALLLTDGKV